MKELQEIKEVKHLATVLTIRLRRMLYNIDVVHNEVKSLLGVIEKIVNAVCKS